MNKEEIIKRLLNQMIYVNDGGIECIDWCDNCKMIVSQTLLDGEYRCEHCHSGNINVLEVNR